MLACTFKPLSRGRFRWVQGPKTKPVILKKAQTQTFRASIQGNERPGPGSPRLREEVRIRVSYDFRRGKCKCGQHYTFSRRVLGYPSIQKFDCPCGRSVIIGYDA